MCYPYIFRLNKQTTELYQKKKHVVNCVGQALSCSIWNTQFLYMYLSGHKSNVRVQFPVFKLISFLRLPTKKPEHIHRRY